MSFEVKGECKRYGPFDLEDEQCTLLKSQQEFLQDTFGLWPVVRYRTAWGIIWVNVHETMPACLGYRPIDICRHVDEVYFPSGEV